MTEDRSVRFLLHNLLYLRDKEHIQRRLFPKRMGWLGAGSDMLIFSFLFFSNSKLSIIVRGGNNTLVY